MSDNIYQKTSCFNCGLFRYFPGWKEARCVMGLLDADYGERGWKFTRPADYERDRKGWNYAAACKYFDDMRG